jgi:hypothetical protein
MYRGINIPVWYMVLTWCSKGSFEKCWLEFRASRDSDFSPDRDNVEDLLRKKYPDELIRKSDEVKR